MGYALKLSIEEVLVQVHCYVCVWQCEMQNLQPGIAGGGTFVACKRRREGKRRRRRKGVLNCLTAHSEKLHLPASNTLCCYLLLLLPTKALHSFVLDHLWIWVFARVLILRRFTRHQCTLLLPTTHQCCYLWWPTFEPSDWSNHPITGQSDLRTWVSGRTPPIRGHRGGLWQTDRPKADVGVSSLFVDPLERHRHGRQIGHEYHRARFQTKIQSFSVFLIELERISHWIGEDLLCPLQITSYSNVILVL